MSVWSSTGSCLPFDSEQEAEFFQKPIVRGSGDANHFVDELFKPH